MISPLANADSFDPSQAQFVLILLGSGGIAGVCIVKTKTLNRSKTPVPL